MMPYFSIPLLPIQTDAPLPTDTLDGFVISSIVQSVPA